MKKIALFVATALLFGCESSEPTDLAKEHQIGALPFVEPSTGAQHPDYSAQYKGATIDQTALIQLGKNLFWDPILSGNKDTACASCHHPDHGYADGKDLSHSLENATGAMVGRNAPSIINTAFNGIDHDGKFDPQTAPMFWDNRTESLEEQAAGPITAAQEMRGDHFIGNDPELWAELTRRLEENDRYLAAFNTAFGASEGTTEISKEQILTAIAAFERTIISTNSPLDRYARGDDSAMTETQIRGMNAFLEAGCSRCHSGPMFSDFELHHLPINPNQKLLEAGMDDESLPMRTPTLRNVALTAPYMHNGTEMTLRQAIEFYDDMDNPANDPDIAALDFEEMESETIDAIEAFLHALTDDSFDKTIPETVPSGLPVGKVAD